MDQIGFDFFYVWVTFGSDKTPYRKRSQSFGPLRFVVNMFMTICIWQVTRKQPPLKYPSAKIVQTTNVTASRSDDSKSNHKTIYRIFKVPPSVLTMPCVKLWSSEHFLCHKSSQAINISELLIRGLNMIMSALYFLFWWEIYHISLSTFHIFPLEIVDGFDMFVVFLYKHPV